MEDFILYKSALKLKELGFAEKCNHTYDTNGQLLEWTEDDYNQSPYHDFNNEIEGVPVGHISAPTVMQAVNWLREKKNIRIWPYCPIEYVPNLDWDMEVCIPNNWRYELYVDNKDKAPVPEIDYETPEAAMNGAINHVCEKLLSTDTDVMDDYPIVCPIITYEQLDDEQKHYIKYMYENSSNLETKDTLKLLFGLECFN